MQTYKGTLVGKGSELERLLEAHAKGQVEKKVLDAHVKAVDDAYLKRHGPPTVPPGWCIGQEPAPEPASAPEDQKGADAVVVGEAGIPETDNRHLLIPPWANNPDTRDVVFAWRCEGNEHIVAWQMWKRFDNPPLVVPRWFIQLNPEAKAAIWEMAATSGEPAPLPEPRGCTPGFIVVEDASMDTNTMAFRTHGEIIQPSVSTVDNRPYYRKGRWE